MDIDKAAHPLTKMKLAIVNRTAFLYLEGKLINIANIVSIVPSYKTENRTMIYVSTSDKALAFETPVGTITEFLISMSDDYE